MERQGQARQVAARTLVAFAIAALGGIALHGTAHADRKSSDPNHLVINFAGDVAWPNGWYGEKIVDKAQHKLFRHVQPILDSADLNFANIECPLTKVKPTIKKRYPIWCKPKRANYFLKAGFNLISLANNHSIDAGQKGIDETLAVMERAKRTRKKLWWAGMARRGGDARKVTRVRVPGKKTPISFFATAYSGWGKSVAGLTSKSLPDRIRKAAATDLVIVSVHSGPEYYHAPFRDTTRKYRQLIDAGATLVVAHHPHVVQGVERYKKGFIFYSLGNFSFASRTTRHLKRRARIYSMIGRVTFRGRSLRRIELIPLYANNRNKWVLAGKTIRPRFSVPQLLSGKFAQFALDEFADWARKVPGTRKRPTKCVRIGDRAYVDLGRPFSKAVRQRLIRQQRIEYRAVGAEGPREATRAERNWKNRGGTPWSAKKTKKRKRRKKRRRRK